jgi:hypothetical protein
MVCAMYMSIDCILKRCDVCDYIHTCIYIYIYIYILRAQHNHCKHQCDCIHTCDLKGLHRKYECAAPECCRYFIQHVFIAAAITTVSDANLSCSAMLQTQDRPRLTYDNARHRSIHMCMFSNAGQHTTQKSAYKLMHSNGRLRKQLKHSNPKSDVIFFFKSEIGCEIFLQVRNRM